MKRLYYMFLMMTFFVFLFVSLYFCTIYGLVMNHIIPLRAVIGFTDQMLSREAYLIVTGVALIVGYAFGKKWWQIIYIDRVYYFDRPKARTRTKKITKKREVAA